MAKKQETVAPSVDVGEVAEVKTTPVVAVAVVEAPELPVKTAPLQARPEIVERVNEMMETLGTFHNIQLPLVRFKEGFTLAEGEDEVEDFEAVIVYTKESNVYYKGRYKAGSKEQPDCFSPDGRVPISNDPTKPVQAATCAVCPHNVFGSGTDGNGKACKNTRPVFLLPKNTEGEFSVVPKVLRVPPTSLGIIKQFMLGVAADYGSYSSVRTKLSLFKKSEDQAYYNIRFSVAGRLTKEEKADVAFIRQGWLKQMQQGNFGVDEDEINVTATAPTAEAVSGEKRF